MVATFHPRAGMLWERVQLPQPGLKLLVQSSTPVERFQDAAASTAMLHSCSTALAPSSLVASSALAASSALVVVFLGLKVRVIGIGWLVVSGGGGLWQAAGST